MAAVDLPFGLTQVTVDELDEYTDRGAASNERLSAHVPNAENTVESFIQAISHFLSSWKNTDENTHGGERPVHDTSMRRRFCFNALGVTLSPISMLISLIASMAPRLSAR